MNAFLKFLNAARSLQKTQGLSKADILNFAKNEFGEITGLMRAQIDNLFKPSKPIKPKDPDFDDTVIKLPIDDQGLPFNPRNPLKKADGGRIGLKEGEGIMQMASAPDPMDERNTVMENIAIQEFGKPLKDLSEDEIIQIEEMMDEMGKSVREKEDMKMASYGYDDAMGESFEEFLRLKKLKEIPEDMEFDEYLDQLDIDIPYSKKDRGAPSIKLAAEGGRIGYSLGGRGIMTLLQFLNKNNPVQAYRKYLKSVKDRTLKANKTGKFTDLPLEVFPVAAGGALVTRGVGKKLESMNEEQKMQNYENTKKEFMEQYKDDPDLLDIMLRNLDDRTFGKVQEKAEGGIMRVGLKDGVFKRGLKAITDTDAYKTFEDRGYNTAVGLNLAFDEVFNLLSGLPGLAEGGRIGYKDGPPDPTKRRFMKTALGIASMIPGAGMLAKGAKVAAPVVTKAAELTGPALAKIVETVMDFGKLVSVKGKRVKEMVTKKKHKGIEVEEDIADGSYIIKKDNKEIYYKPGRMDETGGVEDDIIEILEDTVTKKAGGGIARMLGE